MTRPSSPSSVRIIRRRLGSDVSRTTKQPSTPQKTNAHTPNASTPKTAKKNLSTSATPYQPVVAEQRVRFAQLMQQPNLPLRSKLIVALSAVVRGESTKHIAPQLQQWVNPADKPVAHLLFLQTQRLWFALLEAIAPYHNKPITLIEANAALALGIYQLLFTRIPTYSVIHETVEALHALQRPAQAGFINALLHQADQHRDTLRAHIDAHSTLPLWLKRTLEKDWKKSAPTIIEALKHEAPLFIRVNTRKYDHAEVQQQLNTFLNTNTTSPTTVESIALLPEALHIPHASGELSIMPLFAEGAFSVQDLHAQLAVHLVGDLNNKRVLDACSAPGGKLCHLLEHFAPQTCVALELNAARLSKIQDNLQRLQLMQPCVDVIHADATTWQAQQAFDVILLDAPCSATGVLRRQPDIRLHRTAQDIQTLVALQAQLLDHLWSQLREGGTLLYITCSLLHAENEQQIAQFLARTPDACEIKLAGELPALPNAPQPVGFWGENRPHGRQCFPSLQGGDGFYYAKLMKQEGATHVA